jgi:queuine tRNA-ribosyltransferase
VSAVSWTQTASSGDARAGVLTTPHGDISTPAFMPVGTRGTVKTVDAEDLERLGAQIVLANTYHLMQRPGHETVADLGEVHGLMGWRGPILTDSGGYQVFSLRPVVTEECVVFKSTYDGSLVELTPEDAVHVQEVLGADVAMMLDVLIGLPAPRADVEAAMERTVRWGERALAARTRRDRALFGIVQGGSDAELRERSAKATAALGFDGYGIGGLSVGESREDRTLAIEATVPHLPADATRYVMGLGDTESLLDAVARGVDLFDCVLPTRLARHGKVLTAAGDYSIRRAEWSADASPLEDGCDCTACARYSRGAIRHFLATKEVLGQRLVTLHNLRYTLRLFERCRRAIAENRFTEFAVAVEQRRQTG